MVTLVNRAKMTTSTIGTGTISLGVAVAGYQSFASAGVTNGQTVRYVIEDGENWEIGTGTYTSTGTTLTRSVSQSSNAGSAISLSGSAQVYITAVVADILQPDNNLSDLTNASTARTNLGLAIGTNVQAYDAGLQSIAGLTTAADRMIYTTAADTYAVTTLTAAGRAILDDADAATQRTTLGLGTIATQSAASVSITGGSITGITDLAIADGGTGSSTAAGALLNLGLTATAAELNVLDGITATTTELNYTDGVTSNIQTQLDGKQASLGFTPVQQGGGAGQGANKIYIGWNGSQLALQVDSTSFGSNWPITANAPTAAQVLSATAGAGAGAVGSYALLMAWGQGIVYGNTLAGSSLYPGGVWKGSSSGTSNSPSDNNGDAWIASQNSARSGTWRCMGYCRNTSASVTLWLRIS